MNIIPKFKTRYGENVGIELEIQHPDLDGNVTFLNSDYASEVTSLAVDNGLKFSDGEYVVIGGIKEDKTEIVLISASPSSTTLTVGATSFAHNRGDAVQFTPYNQVVIESSSDGVTYSVLATIDIRFDSNITYYNHTAGTSSTYYRLRFKNEADTVYSQYSDPFVGTGYASNSVGKIINSALILLGEEIDDKLITKEFLYEALNEGRREIDEHRSVIRWPFREVFDYDAGDVISGQYRISLPTDLRDRSTNKNILAVRIGKKKYPLSYITKQEMNAYWQDTAHTTLDGAVLTTDTEITLTSSGDFDESGNIYIAGQAVNEDSDAIAYTANDETTNELSGVTGIRAAGHADGTDVWQNPHFGNPIYYTIDDGYMVFNCPFEDDLSGENIWMDYYKDITDINSDGDLLDEPFFSIYIPWLKWKIKSKKDKNLKMTSDNDYIDWTMKKEAQVEKNYLGQDLTINIDLPDV